MKRIMLVLVLVLVFTSVQLFSVDVSSIEDWTWKAYYQKSSGLDENTYYCKEFRFNVDGNIYNVSGSTKLGEWEQNQNSNELEIAFSSGCNGLDGTVIFSNDLSCGLIGNGSTSIGIVNMYFVRGSRL